MTPLELLANLAANNPKIGEMVEEMIGPEQIALLLAKAISDASTAKISADVVAKMFNISKSAAYDRIANASITLKP